jgi:16S rRNA (cytidine1402-2'-O)-methyltransferase
LEGLADEPRVLIFYEAPHRIRATLEDMLTALGDRTVALGRELTKLHEQLVVRPISRHLEELREERGEFTVVVEGAKVGETGQEVPAPEQMAREFGELTNIAAVGRRDAIRTLAAKYSMSSRDVFSLLERAKTSAE